MFMTEYDEKEHMRRLARDEREEGRKEGHEEGRKEGHEEGRVALKQARSYLQEHGRGAEIEKLIIDDDFFASVIKEAGITYESQKV